MGKSEGIVFQKDDLADRENFRGKRKGKRRNEVKTKKLFFQNGVWGFVPKRGRYSKKMKEKTRGKRKN